MATASTAKSCKCYLLPYHGHKWCIHYPVLAIIFTNLLCYPNVIMPSRKKQKPAEKIPKSTKTGIDKQKCKSTFFNYSETDLQKALELVKDGRAIAAACKQYKVPRTTLRNKLRGKEENGSKDFSSDIHVWVKKGLNTFVRLEQSSPNPEYVHGSLI
ncbi:hypothetical protein KQX54_013448 [Cotesia glomerata]|uniref:HTH psq-type domain-containing protein n=1 Tax=Cotesia glomerata TaxID=32391 RepID=A0AAV7HR86_COTGL|nr:hypothetical protein KQX54_013448 [Cotesia glomerata]